ncbi:MAG: hypothetical protein PHX61_13265 [Alphaproteobacteria bacterium]|nr:hypothetical protein [Alphaproteobacteria bacterium]
MGDYISLMAADSKPFIRGGQSKFYKGCIGTCLGFSNPQSFPSVYSSAMDTVFEEVSADRPRSILKSYDLGKFFGANRKEHLDLLKVFISELESKEVIFNFAYTILNTKRLPDGEVKKYGKGRSPIKLIKALKFLDELNNYYSYISAWKVSKSVFLKNTTVYLDHFNGEITDAWTELCAHHQVYVIPKGDCCSPFISAADLVTAYVDEYLSQNHLHLNENNIKLAFKDCNILNPHVFYIGHNDIESIVPIQEEQIEVHQHYIHPMAFILKEGIFKVESKIIETSPNYQKILEFAHSYGAGIKFFSLEEDYKKIRHGDFVIYFGDEGKKQANYLNQLGYMIEAIDINTLTTQQRTGNDETNK